MTTFSGKDLVCVRGERMVFSGLDFAIEPGGALLLVGPNGSGKSSLLRLMCGLLRPAGGVIAWGGEDIREDPEAHNARMRYVGHYDAIKPVLTVAENLSFWSALQPEVRPVSEALEALNIARLADIPGRFLSAGQKRRANLARLVASPAPLWLLDEPTTALDAATIKALESLMAKHRAGGGMVVVSTHAEVALDGAETLDLSGFQGKGRAA